MPILEFVVIGVGQEPNGPTVALLASLDKGAPRFAGAAFIGLAADEREAFWARVEQAAGYAGPAPQESRLASAGAASTCETSERQRWAPTYKRAGAAANLMF